MNLIPLHVTVDSEELLDCLLDATGLNLTQFVLDLDSLVGDEGFTIELALALTKTLMTENQEYLEIVAEKALEQTLTTPKEEERVGMFPRNYTEEWEREAERHEILTQVVRLLGKL